MHGQNNIYQLFLVRNPSKRADACVGCDEASFGAAGAGGELGSISIDDDEDDIDSAVEP